MSEFMRLMNGIAAAATLKRELDEIGKKEFDKNHPLHDDNLRETWRIRGGSFHGASPDFYGTMPERKLIEFLRSSVMSTTLLIKRMCEPQKAAAVELAVCDACNSAHILLVDDKNGILAHGIIADIDAFIEGLKEAKAEIAKRAATAPAGEMRH